MNLLAVLDGGGVYGSAFHYSMIIAEVGSAFFIFLYLWYKGRLDMNEDAKIQMMQSEDVDENRR